MVPQFWTASTSSARTRGNVTSGWLHSRHNIAVTATANTAADLAENPESGLPEYPFIAFMLVFLM